MHFQDMLFPSSALADFGDLARRAVCYPGSYRFRACDPDTGQLTPVARSHYFPHLFVARHFLQQGLEVWHERYKARAR